MTLARIVVQCPVCHHTGAAAALEVTPGGVSVTCSGCGASTRYPPYRAAERFDAEDVTTLPGSATAPAVPPQPTAGLALGGPGPAHGVKLGVVDGLSVAPELAERYRQVVRQGDRAADHRELVRHAATLRCLDQAGAIYRTRLTRVPGDAIAKEMIDRVMTTAVAAMTAGSKGRVTPPRGSFKAGAVLAVIFFIAALLLTFYLLGQSPGGAP